MKHPLVPALAPLLAACVAFPAAAVAQNRSVLPAACAELPGNAALSLPLRWSEGTLQVRIDSTLLPANFIGKTISGLRLRRPTFLTEPAYPALQRTLTVRGAFVTAPAAALTRGLTFNRGTAPVLFGPAVVSVPATPTVGPGTQVGDEFVVVPFSPPLLVIAGNLFLDFEAGDGPLQVGADHWVDAVWFDDGIENGYVVTTGDGSCTTRSAPTRLVWSNSGSGPVVGGNAALRLTGAEPGVLALAWIGLDPIPRAAAPGYVGFGNSLAALDPTLAGCHQWAPPDGVRGGITDAGGAYNVSFPLTAGVATVGLQIGAQAVWLDLSRPGLPISASNGVVMAVDNIGVGTHCACAYFPGTVTYAPWDTFVGQMPVIVLEHN